MSQATFVMGALLAGFVLWLLLNDKLPVYWSLLTGGAGSTSGSTTG